MSGKASTKAPNWRAVDPRKIATECSPRHVQSVLEDARRDMLAAESTIADLLAALRAIYNHHNAETMAAARAAMDRAER